MSSDRDGEGKSRDGAMVEGGEDGLRRRAQAQ